MRTPPHSAYFGERTLTGQRWRPQAIFFLPKLCHSRLPFLLCVALNLIWLSCALSRDKAPGTENLLRGCHWLGRQELTRNRRGLAANGGGAANSVTPHPDSRAEMVGYFWRSFGVARAGERREICQRTVITESR
jgi:hypothetical protein